MTTYNFVQWEGSDLIPATFSLSLEYNTQISTSALNGAIKTTEMPGARWKARLGYSDLSQDQTNVLLSWLTRMRGMANRFTLYDFANPTTKNGTTGATISSSSTPSGENRITLTGAPAGGDLEVGDMFSVSANNELKVVVNKVSSTIYDVEPGFREQVTPSDYYSGKSIATGANATAVMMLSTNDQASKASQTKIYLGNISVDCLEVF